MTGRQWFLALAVGSLLSFATPLVSVADEVAPTDPGQSALGQQYRQLEAQLISSGRLRTNPAPSDAPYDATTLARNFSEIALGREYGGSSGSWLLRWRDPIRMHVLFGPSVPAAQQSTDSAMIAAYSRRLANVSGHSISITRRDFNFLVLVVTDADLRGLRGFLTHSVPELSERSVRRISNMPHAHLCMVVTIPHAEPQLGIARAVAIVRAENPPLMRRSCIEEELAQGMGLPNDDRGARPSIFNDDEEFGVLTRHDELLLRTLYDPRLAPGMRAPEVDAILPQILGRGR